MILKTDDVVVLRDHTVWKVSAGCLKLVSNMDVKIRLESYDVNGVHNLFTELDIMSVNNVSIKKEIK